MDEIASARFSATPIDRLSSFILSPALEAIGRSPLISLNRVPLDKGAFAFVDYADGEAKRQIMLPVPPIRKRDQEGRLLSDRIDEAL